MAINLLHLISKLLPQDTTGGIGLWSLLCGLVGLLALRISFGKFKGHTNEYGVRIPWRIFWKTALLTVTVFSGAYLLVFFADYFFQTDFRIWSFDLRIFSAAKIWVTVKYPPFFLVYYVGNSLMASRVTFSHWSERKQTWMAVLFNMLTPALFLAISFLPILGVAAYISVKLYRLRGNIWLAGLLNALLVTMITVANTSFSFPY